MTQNNMWTVQKENYGEFLVDCYEGLLKSGSHIFYDLIIICGDGVLKWNKLLFSGVGIMFKEALEHCSDDEVVHVLLPDFKVSDVAVEESLVEFLNSKEIFKKKNEFTNFLLQGNGSNKSGAIVLTPKKEEELTDGVSEICAKKENDGLAEIPEVSDKTSPLN